MIRRVLDAVRGDREKTWEEIAAGVEVNNVEAQPSDTAGRGFFRGLIPPSISGVWSKVRLGLGDDAGIDEVLSTDDNGVSTEESLRQAQSTFPQQSIPPLLEVLASVPGYSSKGTWLPTRPKEASDSAGTVETDLELEEYIPDVQIAETRAAVAEAAAEATAEVSGIASIERIHGNPKLSVRAQGVIGDITFALVAERWFAGTDNAFVGALRVLMKDNGGINEYDFEPACSTLREMDGMEGAKELLAEFEAAHVVWLDKHKDTKREKAEDRAYKASRVAPGGIRI